MPDSEAIKFTAVELRAHMQQLQAPAVELHRHCGAHVHGPDCWCSPMYITRLEAIAMGVPELQRRLHEHYAIQ